MPLPSRSRVTDAYADERLRDKFALLDDLGCVARHAPAAPRIACDAAADEESFHADRHFKD